MTIRYQARRLPHGECEACADLERRYPIIQPKGPRWVLPLALVLCGLFWTVVVYGFVWLLALLVPAS